MKKITFLFVALATVLFVACSSSSSSNTPSGTVKAYYNYLKADNYDKAVECYLLDETISKEQLTAFAAKLKASHTEDNKAAISKFEILNEEMEEDQANVEVKIFYKDGTDETETLTLKKNEKGEWKIALDGK